jgi:hypothetical protein
MAYNYLLFKSLLHISVHSDYHQVPIINEYINVNKPPYATMFGARFYCALTLHVLAPIGGHLQVLCDKIYSTVVY